MDTSTFLLGWSRDSAAQDSNVIWRLCRKIDIAKKLYANYDSDWNKPASNEPLAQEMFPVLCTILLIASCSEEKGRALKLVNSCFNAIGLVSSDTEQAKLLRLTNQRLDEVLDQGASDP